MKAVALTHYLPPEQGSSLFDAELQVPTPTGHDLLIAVKAVSVNPVDNRVLRPKDKVEASPRVLGWDGAGVVVAVGDQVSLFKVGDEVFYGGDLARQGSYSEYQLVDERIAGAKPASLTFEEAAAVPFGGLTAWEALFHRLRIPCGPGAAAGKSILIIGAAGGVGSMAVQLAARLAGMTVIATASRPVSAAWVRDLGAAHVVNHFGDIADQMKSIGYGQVDYVLILSDTDAYYPVAAELIAPYGSICTAVEVKNPIDYGVLWDKSVTLTWVMVFTGIDYQLPTMIEHHRILDAMASLLDAGVLVSTMTEVSSPIDAGTISRALEKLREGRTVGKHVLRDF
jgi:zinc-binding alcohol dehydrogenase family protein